MKKIRFKYTKGANVKYLSHLDILKVFDRAARRASLPLSYTEGFNPRPKFVFGNPLPVGVTSDTEYIDISFNKDVKGQDIVDLLNSSLPKGLRILEGQVLEVGSPNIMSSVSRAEYVVETDLDEDLANKLISLYKSKKEIMTKKKSKTRTQIVDIRPLIHELDYDGKSLRIVTDCGNQSNLRPDLAVNGLADSLGQEINIKGIHRTRLF